jgi:hypothetical protein
MEFDLNRFLLANFLQKKQEAGNGFILLGCSYNSFFFSILVIIIFENVDVTSLQYYFIRT